MRTDGHGRDWRGSDQGPRESGSSARPGRRAGGLACSPGCTMNSRPLVITHVDAESGFSGGEVQVFLLLEGLRERGHRCVLVAPPSSRALAHAEQRGFEVRALAMRNDADLGAVLGLSRALRELAPDLVHLHTGRAAWLGALACRRSGHTAIVTRRMERRIKRGLGTRLVYGSRTAAVVAIAPAIRDELARAGVA
ncbi:MAG: glycosyltransferase, partial [Planctomycetes bacterium]|nr:glycosyltransferase [Planctomycetota bacterium]